MECHKSVSHLNSNLMLSSVNSSRDLVTMPPNKDQEVKKKSSALLAKAAVKNFCESSTIHGISSIFSASNIITRLFWVAIFVSVFSLLIWQISDLVKKLIANDVIMTSKKVYENELEFPIVISSNADPYSNAKLMQFLQTMNNPGEIGLMKAIRNLSWKDVSALGSQLSPRCKFDGYSCQYSSLPFPLVGNSLVFNLDFKWKQKSPGPDHGLTVILRINESDYSNIFDHGYGVFINIGRSPILTRSLQRNKGILDAPGFLTKINMKKKRIIRLPHPYPDDCVENTDVKELKGFHFRDTLERSYSEDFCKFTTMLRNQMISCGVVYPEYKFLLDRYVIMEKSNVSFKIPGNSSEAKSMWNCLERATTENTKNDCRPPCIDEDFDLTISQLRWPSTQVAENLLKDLKYFEPNTSSIQNWTLEDIYKNMLKVEIYFSEFDIEQMEQKPAYDFVKFTSELGGQIGLWIGASVYSAFEVGLFLFSLFYYLIRSKSRGGLVKMRNTETT